LEFEGGLVVGMAVWDVLNGDWLHAFIGGFFCSFFIFFFGGMLSQLFCGKCYYCTSNIQFLFVSLFVFCFFFPAVLSFNFI